MGNTFASRQTMIAISTLITLLAWSVFFALFVHPAEGATLTSMSDTLSDSDLNVASNHTVKFTTPTGISAGQIIFYTFPTSVASNEFSSSSITALGIEDFDFVIGSTEQTVTSTFSGCSGANTVGVTTTVSTASTTIQVEICTSNSAAASASTTLEVGTNATAGGSSGNSQITNPSVAGSYTITIGGTQTDSGSLRVAIIDDVTVTATVGTSFTFTIAGVSSTVACAGVTTSATSTATTIPFGTLSTTASSTLCQTLTVSTNSTNGFTVTVFANQTLTSGNGDDIDYFQNGNATSVPSIWTAPSATLGSEATYGHWGISSEDVNLDTDTGSSTDAFVSGSTYKYVGNFSSARNVFGHTGPVNSTSTKVAVAVEISALQEAANDYTATLTYIATPTF